MAAMTVPDEREQAGRRQRRANLRLALILASVALAFGLGFVARIVWFGAA